MRSLALRVRANWSLAAVLSMAMSSPCLAGGHGHHNVYVVPSTTVVQSAPASVTMVPVATVQSTPAIQFTPQVQSVQFTPQVQTLQVTPQVQSVQTIPVTQSVQFATVPQTVQFVPQLQTVQMVPQNAGVQSVAAGAGDPTDAEFQVLTVGLGGSFTKLRNFETTLRDKARELLANRRGLSDSELTTLLVDFAKTGAQRNRIRVPHRPRDRNDHQEAGGENLPGKPE